MMAEAPERPHADHTADPNMADGAAPDGPETAEPGAPDVTRDGPDMAARDAEAARGEPDIPDMADDWEPDAIFGQWMGPRMVQPISRLPGCIVIKEVLIQGSHGLSIRLCCSAQLLQT